MVVCSCKLLAKLGNSKQLSIEGAIICINLQSGATIKAGVFKV